MKKTLMLVKYQKNIYQFLLCFAEKPTIKIPKMQRCFNKHLNILLINKIRLPIWHSGNLFNKLNICRLVYKNSENSLHHINF